MVMPAIDRTFMEICSSQCQQFLAAVPKNLEAIRVLEGRWPSFTQKLLSHRNGPVLRGTSPSVVLLHQGQLICQAWRRASLLKHSRLIARSKSSLSLHIRWFMLAVDDSERSRFQR